MIDTTPNATPDDPFGLHGRIAMVIGAAHGIGRATARQLSQHGVSVHAVDIDGDAMDDLSRQGAEMRGRITAHAFDATKADAITTCVDSIVRQDGAIDILVNSTGHYLHRPEDFADTDESQWHDALDLNLWATLRSCRAVLPHMLAAERGSIVNLTTVEAHRGKPQHAVYAAAKAAVEQFSKSVALEVAGRGVRVNCVAPDVTESQQLPYAEWLSDDDRERIPNWVPVGRLGQPDDVASVVLFLASDLSRFVTGTSITADGGTLAAGGWYQRLPAKGWTNRPRQP